MQEQDKLAELLSKIESLAATSSYPETTPLFSELFTIAPGHPAGLRLLAKCMLQVDQQEQALALLSDSIDPDWPDVPTILQISGILKNLHRDDEAADLLFASVHANPESAELIAEATAALTLLGRKDDLATLTQITTPSA